MPPLESLKAAEIKVSGDPFAPRFDGECREVGIWNEVPPSVGLEAQAFEYGPVSFTWRNGQTIGLGSNGLREFNRRARRRGGIKYPGMGYDSKKTAQCKVREAKGVLCARDPIKPGLELGMLRGVFSKCPDEDIDVK